MPVETLEDRMNAAQTMVERVKILVEEIHQPDIAYNLMPGETTKVDDIALIQCFYGTDSARIRATSTALDFMLRMTRLPSTWMFIECQKSRNDCVFGWLRRYGIKYKFVQMPRESEGLFLKTPLWNIGAESCEESRLCFVDSDVVIEDSDWIEKAASSFTDHDVLSLASIQYNESDENCELKETIGYKWAERHEVEKSHCGFTIGLTRKAFKALGGFSASIILDDINTYYRILGEKMFKPFEYWTRQFKLDGTERHGYPFNLGYIDSPACHVWHENVVSKYNAITVLMDYLGCTHSDLIVPGKKISRNGKIEFNLPTWNLDNPYADVVRKSISEYMATMSDLENEKNIDIVKLFIKNMQETYGKPDDQHPLYVVSTVKNGFGFTLEKMVEFRNNVEKKFVQTDYKPIIVFFTDAKFDFASSEINAFPLKNYDAENEVAQCFRKDLKIPHGSTIYYIPFDVKDFDERLWIPSEKIEGRNGTVIFSR